MFNIKFANFVGLSLFLLSMVGINTNAYSESSNWYGGINIGRGDLDFSGYDDSSSLSLYAGNNLSDNGAYEFGYTDLGQFDVSGVPGTYIEVTGFEITGIGKMPVSNSVDLFAKFGIYFWNLDAVIFGTNIGGDDDNSITLGAGADFSFNGNVSGRVAFQQYSDVSDEDITNISIGIHTNF
ncbi:MAG: outer membrane beta-barrel protein [Gammaproteobacteria bacterium]|nr:outer membrane beta-barrel protein [Gammaproteobacteria bacterium]